MSPARLKNNSLHGELGGDADRLGSHVELKLVAVPLEVLRGWAGEGRQESKWSTKVTLLSLASK